MRKEEKEKKNKKNKKRMRVISARDHHLARDSNSDSAMRDWYPESPQYLEMGAGTKLGIDGTK